MCKNTCVYVWVRLASTTAHVRGKVLQGVGRRSRPSTSFNEHLPPSSRKRHAVVVWCGVVLVVEGAERVGRPFHSSVCGSERIGTAVVASINRHSDAIVMRTHASHMHVTALTRESLSTGHSPHTAHHTPKLDTWSAGLSPPNSAPLKHGPSRTWGTTHTTHDIRGNTQNNHTYITTRVNLTFMRLPTPYTTVPCTHLAERQQRATNGGPAHGARPTASATIQRRGIA